MIAGGHYAKNASQEGTYCLLYYFDPNIYIFKLYRIFINQAILICNESTNYNFYLLMDYLQMEFGEPIIRCATLSPPSAKYQIDRSSIYTLAELRHPTIIIPVGFCSY